MPAVLVLGQDRSSSATSLYLLRKIIAQLPLGISVDKRPSGKWQSKSLHQQRSSRLPRWVCVGLSYVVVFLVVWNRFCFLWRPGVIKHLAEGRKMVSVEMGSRYLE